MVQKKPIPGFKEILNQTDLHQGKRTQTLEPYVTGIHDSLGFSTGHAVTDFRIPCTRFQSLSLELGFWVLIVSGFLKLYSRL